MLQRRRMIIVAALAMAGNKAVIRIRKIMMMRTMMNMMKMKRIITKRM